MRLLESDERGSNGAQGLNPEKDFWINADMKRSDDDNAADVLGLCVCVCV